MRIALINPKLKTWSPSIFAPLGLAYVASALERVGHFVKIIDLNSHNIPDHKLAKQVTDADVIGITGMVTEYVEVVRLGVLVRQINSRAKIILGGALATTWTERVLISSKADFAVMGEGEEVVVNLLTALESSRDFNNIKGIAYRTGDKIVINPREEPIANPDDIQFPARHLLDMGSYVDKFFRLYDKELRNVKGTTLYSSRGCPFACSFCFTGMWGHKWRGRSPDSMIAEIKQLQNDYGYNGFSFYDDNFVVDKKRVFEFCRKVKEQNLKIYWICNGRVDLMTEEMIKAMYDAGCRGIAYGIESGNQEIVNSIEKGITLDQVERVTKLTEDAGIKVIGLFMLGMLGETKETIKQTIEFARKLNLSFYCFALTVPLYGTKLYELAESRGLISSKEQQDWNFHANANLTLDCTKEELEQFGRDVFREFNLEKGYGEHPLLNPRLWTDGIRSYMFLVGKRSSKELIERAWGFIRR